MKTCSLNNNKCQIILSFYILQYTTVKLEKLRILLTRISFAQDGVDKCENLHK